MTTATLPTRRQNGVLKTLDEIGVFIWRNLAHIPRVPERLLDLTYVEAASKELGPFVIENTSSNLPGCR